MAPSNTYALAKRAEYAPKVRHARAADIPAFAGEQHTIRATVLVAALHIAAIASLISPLKTVEPAPVLSFTVTLMDLSSSPHTISTAASSASAPAAKAEKKPAEETKVDEHAAKLKKQVKAAAAPSPKTRAPLSHNSQAQAAVLAPINPAQFDAAYLQNPKPAYPALSRRLGEQGRILLHVYVNAQGQAQSVRLSKSSGFDRLDNAAIDAVSRWRFAAAKQGEQFVASWVQVPVTFILE